jgi:hypothetical protein
MFERKHALIIVFIIVVIAIAILAYDNSEEAKAETKAPVEQTVLTPVIKPMSSINTTKVESTMSSLVPDYTPEATTPNLVPMKGIDTTKVESSMSSVVPDYDPLQDKASNPYTS